MWYPRVNSSLSGLRSVQTKRKSVANNNNNNKCDNSGNGAPDHGRRKLDSQAVNGNSKRGYGGSPNGGLRASLARGRRKCLPAEGGHSYGAVNYGTDACVRDAGGSSRRKQEAKTNKRHNNNIKNNDNRGGNGASRKERKSDEQGSGGLVMEKVIILKRGQTIRDVVAAPSGDAEMARVSDGDEMVDGRGCSKLNWPETPDRVRVDWDARSVVGSDARLGEIGCEDVRKQADQVSRSREDLEITPPARLGTNPSTILPESGRCGVCRGKTPRGSSDSLEEEEEEQSYSSSSSSSSPSAEFMLEKWAGAPYCKSPSPRCLPLPKFSMQHRVTSDGKDSLDFAGLQMESGNCSAPETLISETLNEALLSLPVFRSCANLIPQAGVDAFATRGLRRLLHLD